MRQMLHVYDYKQYTKKNSVARYTYDIYSFRLVDSVPDLIA